MLRSVGPAAADHDLLHARLGASGQTSGSSEPSHVRRFISWIYNHRRAAILLFVTLLTFLLGMGTGFTLSFRLGYVLVIMLVISFVWSRIGFARINARVFRPSRPIRVGELLSETVEIANYGGLPNPWIEIEEITDIPGLKTGRIIDMPGLIVRRSFQIEAPMAMRGEFNLGPLVVRSADPFGLFPNYRSYQGAARLMVYPSAVSLPDFAMVHLNLNGDAGDRRRTHVVSPQVSSVRDYVAGDSVSRIHWPSSARQGRLMVKLFDQGEAGEVWVVFDQSCTTAAGYAAESVDEYGATIAISTVEKYMGMQLPVGYVSFGSDPITLSPAVGPGQLEAITRNITVSKPAGTVELVEILAELDPAIGANTALVVITASRSSDWLKALEGLAGRGVNVSVVLLDRYSFLDEKDKSNTESDSNSKILVDLASAGLRTYSVKQGDPIRSSLSDPIHETLLITPDDEMGSPGAGQVGITAGDVD